MQELTTEYLDATNKLLKMTSTGSLTAAQMDILSQIARNTAIMADQLSFLVKKSALV